MPETTASKQECLQHLRYFTRRWDELTSPAHLELRFLSADDKAIIKDIARFPCSPEGLEQAADHAVAMNQHRLNAYMVVNPIDAMQVIPTGKGASDEHILASCYHWADADDETAAQNIREFVGPKPTAVVITGTKPSARPHVYWELEDWTYNLKAWTATQSGIAARLESDASVINPSRIMRLGGTINWPKPKKKAKGYIEEKTRFQEKDPDERPPVTSEQMHRVFGRAVAAPTASPSGFDVDTGQTGKTVEQYADALRRARTDGEKHTGVRDLTAMLAGAGVKRDMTEAIVRGACPIWDDGVENLIETAYAKYWKPEEQKVAAAIEAAEAGRKSEYFSASEFAGQEAPEREWLVPDLIPDKTATLLGGDGGTGKSLLALQLAIAVASGSRWIGRETKPGPVLFFTAEDDKSELHRRVVDIAGQMNCDVSALDKLVMRSVVGEDALLAVEGQIALMETELYKDLYRRAEQDRPALVVIDTLANVYPANESDRAKVRQFVSMLIRIAFDLDCAVLLLAHPSLSGLTSGMGTSGSTAWNNSVRARLYLSRVVVDGVEEDPDARLLENKKSNYGPTGEQIELEYRRGAFTTKRPIAGLDRMAANQRADRVFLKLLRLMTEQGRYVSANPGPSYAPTVFEKHPDAEGCNKRAFRASMERLFSSGQIEIAKHGRTGKERSHIKIGDQR